MTKEQIGIHAYKRGDHHLRSLIAKLWSSFNPTTLTDNLRGVLKYVNDFSEDDLEKIIPCFYPESAKRNTFLLREGSICKEFYFVNKGCLRTYFLDKRGNEKTRYVMPDLYIGTALTSFVSQQPSSEFIEVLDDSELMAISRQDFFRLNKELDSWKVFYQKILEMAYSFQNKKIEGLVTLSAKQRYEQLLHDQPILVQRLSNKVLASYLDLKPETLSRLKSKQRF